MSPLTNNDNELYIVAVGASAGGLEAIHEFFDNMPSNGNLSFVIIQHLSADYKSLLVELVSKHTYMKVLEAQHDTFVEKNCVYVIPNNKLLTIDNGRLQLSEKNFEKAPNTAIDTFLRSLAEDQGSKAIAVILSGTGTDGTKGIATIQKEGKQYIMFLKDETRYPPQKNIRIATSNTLTGEYGQPSEPITGKYWAEGPTILRLSGQWVVYFDKYSEHKYGAVVSPDLKSWTDISEQIETPKGMRHGSIFSVTTKELEKLKEKIAK